MKRSSSGSTLHLAAIAVFLVAVLAGAFLLLRDRDSEARTLPEVTSIEAVESAAGSPLHLAEPTEETQAATPEAESPTRVALDKKIEPKKAAKAKPKGPWITGRAIDPYGNAVEGAWITVSPWSQMAQTLAMEQMGMGSSGNEPPKNSVKTDAEGKFKIHRRRKLGTEIAVTARGKGFLVTRDRRVLASADHEDIDLEALVLDPGIIIRGTVIDDAGVPVAGATVKRGAGPEGPLAFAAGIMEEFGMGGGGGVKTDEEGRFELPHEEAGPYSLTASHENFPEVSIAGETPTHGTLDGVELHFSAPAKIVGKIVNMPDAAVARLQAAANPANADNDETQKNKIFVSARLIDDRGDASGEDDTPGVMGFFAGLGGGDQNEVQADGTFEISGLRPGSQYEVCAFRKGGFLQKEDCTEKVKIEAPSQLLELPYDQGAVLTFRVVDARNSKPVKDMKIDHSWVGDENFLADIMSSMGGPAQEKSYPGGRVTLDELRPPTEGARSTLTIEAPGYTSLTENDILIPAQGEKDLGVLRLQPAPILRVQVLELGTGKPLSRIRVSFAEERTTSSFVEPSEDSDGVQVRIGVGGSGRDVDLSEVFGTNARGKTDENGMVELTVFPTSRGVLRLKSTRYAPRKIEGIVITKDSGVTSRTETISRGAEVVVLVLDENGKPAPGVPIQHEGPEGLGVSDMTAKKTGKKGTAKYLRLSPGEHRFRVVEHGVDMGQGTISVSTFTGTEDDDDDWSVLQLTDGAVRELRLEPPLRARLEGTVRSSAGPLVGATVSLQFGTDENNPITEMGGAWGEMLASGGLKGRTNGDGAYKIERIPVGEYTLVVRHPNRAVPERFTVSVGRGDNEFSVRLAGGAIAGTVMDDTGQAIGGASVRVRRSSGGIDWDDFDDMTSAFGNVLGNRADSTTTAADGSYRFDGLPEDTKLSISVRADGHVPGRSEVIELGRDEIENDVDVSLIRGGTLRIRVNGQETPFLRARAIYAGEESGFDKNRSAFVSNGVAVIKGLHAGPWKVEVDSPMSELESPSEEVTVTPGNETEVTLER